MTTGSRTLVVGGATVFIPSIAVTNIGADTLTKIFIFSSPGFEQVLRAVSSLPGESPQSAPSERAEAFRAGHAEAGPLDC